MKKFFIKLCIFCILLFLPILLPNAIYKNTNYWKAENDVYKFSSVPSNITLANVGTSHGFAGFRYVDIYDGVAFNFALPYQNYDFDLCVLKNYIKNFSEGAILLVPISYLQVTATLEHEVPNFRQRYYRFLSAKNMPGWRMAEYIRYSLVPIFSAGGVFNIIDRIKNDISDEALDPFAFVTSTMAHNPEKFEGYCQNKLYQWTREDVDKGEDGFIFNTEAVSKIIDFCYANNLTPVLVTTPMPYRINELFSEKAGFFETFYRFTSNLQQKYPALKYYDFSHDEELGNAELFGDGEHLNSFGAEIFTKKVIDALVADGLL